MENVYQYVGNQYGEYQYGGGGGGGGENQQGNNNQYQYYNNQNNNNYDYGELYIGPHCSSSGQIHYAVFYDEACTYKTSDVEVRQVLGGYNLDESPLHPSACIPCSNAVRFDPRL